jgi:Fe-S oxidoreductase
MLRDLERENVSVRKVIYFSGCTANYIEPEIGQAAVEVLLKNKLQPLFPEQGCCALPQLSYGRIGSFKKRAEANIKSLLEFDSDIVTACTSCALTLKREYPARLGSNKAREISQRTYDIMEYLYRLKQRGELLTSFNSLNLSVLYHTPCHLKVLGADVAEQRLELLRLVPGMKVNQIDRGCCGMGGTFGMKSSYYAISMAIGKPLFEEIERHAPDLVLTECPACKQQIEHGTGLKVSHPILLFKKAYGI